MKKILSLLLVLVMLLGMMPMTAFATEKDPGRLSLEGLNVLCLGDSITAGQGLTNDTRWTNVLASKYGWNLTNKSQGGISMTSYYYTANGQTDVSIAKKAEVLKTLTTKPDVIIVWGGHNDTSYRYSPLGTWDDETTDSFKGALKYIAELADEYAPDATLFVLTPLWNNENPSTLKVPEGTTDTNWMFVDAIYDGAEAYGWIPINMDLCGITPFTKSGLLLDNIHPNEAGTEKIVEYLSEELASYGANSKKEAIIFNQSTVSMKPGESTTLKAVLSPRSGTGTMTFTWSSSDSSVATVYTSGKITAVAPGTAVITATAPNGISADISVSVVCEHTYEPSVTAPTCTEQGYTTYTCECGDSYVADYVSAAGHNYAEGTCTVCGEADPDYSESAWDTWVAFGTSITEDKDYMRPNATNIMGTYIPYLSELMGVDAPDANYSIGGAAFSTHLLMYIYYAKYQKNGLTYNGYTHTAIKNADLITIEGGVNDFYGSVPLGKVGDTVPYSKADPISVNPNSTNNFGGTTDGTFAGCIYAAITELRRVAPDATIVFITDNAGTGSCAATKANALGHYLHDYNDMMTAVAESMGCYVIDAGRTAGFEENLKTYLSDHIHQSEAGGEAYANAIWRGLCAIRNGERPESGHTHRYTESVTAPTCTEQGYTTYTCVCGDSYVDDYVDAEGEHDFTDWYTTKEAAYNADGEESRDCTKCSHVEFRSVKLEVVTSGNVGYGTPYTDEVTYTLYIDGTMVISGQGKVYCSDWRGDYQPYKDYRTQVKTLIVEEGITSTSGGCFAHFYNLETVILPSSLTQINNNAFMSSFSSSITSITIPETVTYIGAYSYGFYYGKGGTTFTDIIIENPNVRFVDNKAVFNAGNNLANLTLYSYGANNNVSAYAQKYGCKYVDLESYKTGVYAGVEYMYYDGVLTLSAAQNDAIIAGEDAPWNTEKNNVRKIVIESGITGISANAFKDYYNLESIEINNEIRFVGDGAFSTTEISNIALTLILPRTVKSVGTGIFAGRQNVNLTAYLGSAAADIKDPGVRLTLKKQFKLLLIGNSYSEDASSCGQGMTQSQLLDILQAMLGKDADVTVALLSSGGKGVNWHATQAEQGNSAYSFKIISSNSPTWTTIGSASSYQALTWTDWDVVSLQPYNISASTGIEAVAYPDSTDAKFRDLETASEYMLDYIGIHAPDAEIYCYMHWAQTSSTTLNANISYYNRLAPHYLGMMEHTGNATGTKYTSIIPVGLSIQNARTTYLALLAYNTSAYDDGNLNLTTDAQIGLQRDGGHLSFNIGRYIAGLTFAEMIVPKEMRVDDYKLPDIRVTESVGELPKEYTEIAQKSVFAAVESWRNGSLAVTNIEGYTEDPTVAAKQMIEAMSLNLNCGDATSIEQQIRNLDFAALPADFAIETVVVDTKTYTATVTLRFGYTSVIVEINYNIASHDYKNGICSGCGESCESVGHVYKDEFDAFCDGCNAIREINYPADKVELREIDGVKYIYVNGKTSVEGLFKVGDDYYCATWGGVVLTGDQYVHLSYCDKAAGRHFYFSEDGKMLDKGFVTGEDGIKRLYVDSRTSVEGLFEVDGKYYLATWGGVVLTDGRYYISESFVDGIDGGRNFTVGSDGEILDGVVEIDGQKYYYDFGTTVFPGIYEIDGIEYTVTWGGLIEE